MIAKATIKPTCVYANFDDALASLFNVVDSVSEQTINNWYLGVVTREDTTSANYIRNATEKWLTEINGKRVDAKKFIDDIVDIASENDIDIDYAENNEMISPISGGAIFGKYIRKNRNICINEEVEHPLAIARIMAHEMGRAYLHDFYDISGVISPGYWDDEAITETSTFLVLSKYNINIINLSSFYIARTIRSCVLDRDHIIELAKTRGATMAFSMLHDIRFLLTL